MRSNSGLTIIELVISLAITMVVTGALLRVFVDSTTNQAFVEGQNDAEAQARQPLDTLIDHLRNAQANKDNDLAVIKSGAAISVEYYTSNGGGDDETVRYFLDGTDLKRTEGAVTNIVMSNVQDLEFTYFKSNTSPAQYYTGTVPTDDPNAPTAVELPVLAQINVRVVANVDGYMRELEGFVRLRNSPFKGRL